MPIAPRTVALLVASLVLLLSCSFNSYPAAQNFIRPATSDCSPGDAYCNAENAVHVFADANGTLYPSGWASHPEFSKVRRGRSLLNGTKPGSPLRRLVEADEERQLREIAALGQAPGRIFILIHGYNNTVAEADGAYRLVEPQLGATGDDRIIRFYWDGLTGSGIGSGRIWFFATGNSQLVGSRALRNILRQFHGKDIYLIGHSRGASVILSALGNPVYDPDFRRKTLKLGKKWGDPYQDIMSPAPLAAQGNRLRIVIAAPAVDRIDFCDAHYQPLTGGVDCRGEQLRPLGPQVKSFRYTTNEKDPVLDKFVGLSGGFNPTGLGLHKRVGDELKEERYKILDPYPIEPAVRQHGFDWYVEHTTFKQMLRDALAERG